MAEYPVRRLTSEDASSYRVIRLEGLEKSPEAFGASFEEEAESDINLFQKYLNEGIVFGAFDKNELIGVMGINGFVRTKTSHKAELWGVYVRASHRRKGIADKLLHSILDWAEKHVQQVKCTVVTTNAAAKAFYEKNGFIIHGTQPDSLRIGGKSYNEYFMVRQF